MSIAGLVNQEWRPSQVLTVVVVSQVLLTSRCDAVTVHYIRSLFSWRMGYMPTLQQWENLRVSFHYQFHISYSQCVSSYSVLGCSSCQSCPLGYEAESTMFCIACKAGTCIKNAIEIFTHFLCTGYHRDQTRDNCTLCESGYYALEPGQSKCKECNAGYYCEVCYCFKCYPESYSIHQAVLFNVMEHKSVLQAQQHLVLAILDSLNLMTNIL